MVSNSNYTHTAIIRMCGDEEGDGCCAKMRRNPCLSACIIITIIILLILVIVFIALAVAGWAAFGLAHQIRGPEVNLRNQDKYCYGKTLVDEKVAAARYCNCKTSFFKPCLGQLNILTVPD